MAITKAEAEYLIERLNAGMIAPNRLLYMDTGMR